MQENGYLNLIKQRDLLLQPIFNGVRAAETRLKFLNLQIEKMESNPLVFDKNFVFKKPGYTTRLIKVLCAQASIGSNFASNDLSKYADWVIEQRGLNS